MKRNLRDAPPWVTIWPLSIAEVEPVVREMVEEGTVRLDPELGFVWLKDEDDPEPE